MDKYIMYIGCNIGKRNKKTKIYKIIEKYIVNNFNGGNIDITKGIYKDNNNRIIKEWSLTVSIFTDNNIQDIIKDIETLKILCKQECIILEYVPSNKNVYEI